jgi:hypothetical protein
MFQRPPTSWNSAAVPSPSSVVRLAAAYPERQAYPTTLISGGAWFVANTVASRPLAVHGAEFPVGVTEGGLDVAGTGVLAGTVALVELVVERPA